MNTQTIINELENWEHRAIQLKEFETTIKGITLPNDVFNNIKREISEELTICEEQIEQINNDLPTIDYENL